MTRPDAHHPRWLDEREQRAWWALLEIGSGLFDTINADLKAQAGLSLEDYEVLHLLSVSPTSSRRLGELNDEMLASRTRLTQRIDRLAERGLLTKQRCPDDGRAVDVVLTEAGRSLLAEIAPGHVDSVRRHVFDHLTRGDVEALARGLDKVAQHLHDNRRG